MIRPVRGIQFLVALAFINAGCAQMGGTHVAGSSSSSTIDWPTPTIDNALAPLPADPVMLPLAAMPAETRATVIPAQRTVTPRRSAAAPQTAPVAPATVTAPARDVWQRVRDGFQMAAVDHSLVRDWETYYASRPDYFARMIENSSHFLYHITNEVERRGMPLEIALLPMIESAYNPVAYSTAHASGIWQFIPSTGKNYGLKQNWWYDGRRDVIAATGAALDYLQTLHRMFNDWELALAAYNWGEGAVQRAIDRNLARGLPTNYAGIAAANMPAETRNYVPKLIAVKNIIFNPARYGLNLAHVPNEPYFEVITVRRHIDLKRAAQFAGMTVEEFRFLNPAHNKPVINADSAETIVLPKHKVGMFTANMAENEGKPLVSMKTHTVRAGERADAIAARYSMSVAELNNLNGVGGRRQITTGQTLMVANRDDLQPVLADIPVATNLVSAATRPVYNHPVTRKVVVNRGGVARTIVVTQPAQRVNARAPVRRPVVVTKHTTPGKAATANAKPVATIRNR